MHKTLEELNEKIFVLQQQIKGCEVMLVNLKHTAWEIKEKIMDEEEKELEKIFTNWSLN